MKTVIDAINAFEGALPIYVPCLSGWGFYYDNTGAVTGYKYNGNFVCTKKGLREVISQMETNFGTSDYYIDYKANYTRPPKEHKKEEELLKLTKFLVENNIGVIGESSVDVVIRELSEKHDIDARTDKEKAIGKLMDKLPMEATIKEVLGLAYDELVRE